MSCIGTANVIGTSFGTTVDIYNCIGTSTETLYVNLRKISKTNGNFH